MKIGDWKKMLSGDQNAFVSVYECYYQSLFSYGFTLCADRELTKDCIQDMFLEIWKTRDKVNQDVKDIKSYLFTWLRRKIGQALNKSDRLQLQENFTPAQEFSFAECSYEDLLILFQEKELNKQKVRKALTQLTKKQLEMIRLRFFENLSYSEIATQTLLSPRTVYNFVYEALKTLRQSMRLFSYLYCF